MGAVLCICFLILWLFRGTFASLILPEGLLTHIKKKLSLSLLSVHMTVGTAVLGKTAQIMEVVINSQESTVLATEQRTGLKFYFNLKSL